MTASAPRPAWLETIPRYRLGDGLLLFEADPNGPYVTYADVLAACPPPAEPEPATPSCKADIAGHNLHVWAAGRCQCGALPAFIDHTYSDMPVNAASPPPAEARDWQVIETVPTDYRWVLVWAEDLDYSVYRFGPGLIAEPDEPQWTHWRELPDPPGRAPGRPDGRKA